MSGKTCENCAYRDVPRSSAPCSECEADTLNDMWEEIEDED